MATNKTEQQTNGNESTYRVDFVFDTGCNYEDRVCILRAANVNEALDIFMKWIIPQLGSDEWVHPSSIKVKKIDNDAKVIYTNFRSYCRKVNKSAV